MLMIAKAFFVMMLLYFYLLEIYDVKTDNALY